MLFCLLNIFIFNQIAAIRLTVKDLLTSTTKGKLILAEFEIDKKIDTKSITTLLIYYEFDFTKNYR